MGTKKISAKEEIQQKSLAEDARHLRYGPKDAILERIEICLRSIFIIYKLNFTLRKKAKENLQRSMTVESGKMLMLLNMLTQTYTADSVETAQLNRVPTEI